MIISLIQTTKRLKRKVYIKGTLFIYQTSPALLYFGNSSVFHYTFFLKIAFLLWEWKMEVSEI